MHWECIPGSGRSKAESAAPRGLIVLVFVRGIDSDCSSVTDDRAPWRACRDRTCNEE